jgi:hypothetical protein
MSGSGWLAAIFGIIILAAIVVLILWALGVFEKKCTTDTDCADQDGKKKCGLAGDREGKCVQCNAEGDCAADQTCKEYKCVAKAT